MSAWDVFGPRATEEELWLRDKLDAIARERDELRAELAIARGEVERLQLPQRVTLAELGELRTSLAAIEKTNKLLHRVLREENLRLRELLREVLACPYEVFQTGLGDRIEAALAGEGEP